MNPGTRLSHYEILSRIRAGGMGEVYLAQDTKLDRKVALKILPSELAANQDRMRRFAGRGHAYTDEARVNELERMVGRLTMENDFLKKLLAKLETES